jgi:hypothetical protein
MRNKQQGLIQEDFQLVQFQNRSFSAEETSIF